MNRTCSTRVNSCNVVSMGNIQLTGRDIEFICIATVIIIAARRARDIYVITIGSIDRVSHNSIAA